jgi:hypothetical protein
MEWILLVAFAATLIGGALAYRFLAAGTRAEPWILIGAATVLLALAWAPGTSDSIGPQLVLTGGASVVIIRSFMLFRLRST